MNTIESIAWSAELRNLGRRFGERIAVNTGAATLSYRMLDRMAHGLAERIVMRGLTAGSRVAILLPNGCEAVWSGYGVTLAGACEVPINPVSTDDEIEWFRTIAKFSLVVTDRARADRIRDLGLEVLLVDDIEPANDDQTSAPIDANAWGRLIFSSGTTGRPKGLVYTHGRRWLANQMLKSVLPFSPQPGARTLLMTPYVHGAALQTFAWLDHGGEVVLLNGIDVPHVTAFLESGTIEAVFAPPTVIAKFAELFGERRFTGVRCVFTGTSTLTPGLYAKARAMFGPVVRITYGKGENTNPITVLEPADTEAYFRDESAAEGACLGWPASGVEVATHDDTGARLPINAEGEIWLRSRHMYIGHVDAQGFQPVGDGGWHRTGDSGRIDERGRLWLLGRLADVIKSGGYKIYPQEIEAALSGMPGCSQIGIASLPSEYWGEVIIAAADGVAANTDLAASAASRLASLARYKHPRAFIALDALPRNAQGKLSRRDLRAAILARYRLEDGPHPRLVALST